MADISNSQKLSRSRSKNVRIENEPYIFKLNRIKQIVIPQKITFVRGPIQKTGTFIQEKNYWIFLPDQLTQLLFQEHTYIFESHMAHLFPPTNNINVLTFLSAFELYLYDPDNMLKSEKIKSFTSSIASLYSNNVVSSLLYETESSYVETIKIDPLRNTPAIFILRFLYYLPTIMKGENPDTEVSKNLKIDLESLIEFSSKNINRYFFLPGPSLQPKINSSFGTKAAKSGSGKQSIIVLNKSKN